MQSKRIAAAAATAATLAATIAPAQAGAFTLGVGDRADADVAASKALGARVYRVVIDPAVPLATYDQRIYAHRAAGQEPQLVVGGTGTINHASSRGVVPAAVAVARRWPFAYSIGVINEPNESGMSVCEYTRTWAEAYRSLRVLGVRRIPFGEWSPNQTIAWQAATYHRCPNTSPFVRRHATRIAWHGYGAAIDLGDDLRALARQWGAVQPRLLVTEAGAVLRFRAASVGSDLDADLVGLRYWRRALRAARRDHFDELVAWDLTAPPAGSVWDSSLIEPSGRLRPAFGLIAAAAHR